MKIEFKKVPTIKKELETSFDSVKIEGTFCRISSSLVKIEANLKGNVDIDCSRCGSSEPFFLDEEFLVIEIENSLIDFDEIIQSELNSIKSDYHICKNCLEDNQLFEKEF